MNKHKNKFKKIIKINVCFEMEYNYIIKFNDSAYKIPSGVHWYHTLRLRLLSSCKKYKLKKGTNFVHIIFGDLLVLFITCKFSQKEYANFSQTSF